ncbi:uncharacterized protein RSE6_07667 [Rhynchosporium secalis]|uniref:SAP domain-containing protein n=1 Tax=Rhynchosporium secalis TaxID=38038 RepID=A0A1E1MDK8_RHYSE|nr:uncharacterized protein RSE6_07667 [Rhynchosporium secalis]
MTRPARYVDLKVPALREKCEESGLDNAGLRRDLIQRLERKDRLIEESARKEKVRESERLRSQEKSSVGGGYQGSSSRAPSRQGRSRDIQRAEGEDRVGFEVTRSSFGFADDGQERPQMIFQNTARPRMASDPRADGQFDPLAPPPASSSNRDLPFRQRNEGPTHYRAERSITDLSEVELEDILFANYMPPQSEGSRLQRRMKIKAEHDVGVDVARSKKEASMKRLFAKYDIEVDKLRIERDEKLVGLDRELGPKQEKSRHWFPAFNRLRALREARDLQTHPRDFAPRPAPYVIQPYRSAPAPQHPQLNARSFSPPKANFSSQPQPPVLKRKATSPLRSQYQAEGQNDHGR